MNDSKNTRRTTASSQTRPSKRYGVSLMEVLISIGVISLGIFGVASLIPVAQFKVAEGTSKDRQAAFGPSAAAQFRIEDMGNPDTWYAPVPRYLSKGGQIRKRAFCIDPLGLAENMVGTDYPGAMYRFPANAAERDSFFLPRITLKKLRHAQVGVELALARDMCFLKDELVFDRPTDQGKQPRRKYFVDANGVPTSSLSSASLAWFATASPTVILDPLTGNPVHSDEFLLSIVITKDRVPLLALTEENYAQATCHFAGEIELFNSPVVATGADDQMKMTDLRIGDWLLLSKPVSAALANDSTGKRVYRWTQIIGTSDAEDATADISRRFTISNDDFFRPEATPGEMGYAVIFMRGVSAVYERTIRLENSSMWSQ